MKKYDLQYEGGKCPMGYEYVEGYTNFSGRWVEGYCRKLPKHQPRIERNRERAQDERYQNTEDENSFETLWNACEKQWILAVKGIIGETRLRHLTCERLLEGRTEESQRI